MASFSRVAPFARLPSRERRQAMADHVERAKQLTGKRFKRGELQEVEESAMFLARGHAVAEGYALAERALVLRDEGRFDDPRAIELMGSYRRDLESQRDLTTLMGNRNVSPVSDGEVFERLLRVPFNHAIERFQEALSHRLDHASVQALSRR